MNMNRLQEKKSEVIPILKGHELTDGSTKTTDQLKSQYVELTDNIINKILTGSVVTNPETNETERKPYDTVVWLDKSARPLAWLTSELWPILAGEHGTDDKISDSPKKPDFKFVNIDREQWINEVDPNGTGYMDVRHVKKSIIRGLRSIFVEPKYKQAGVTEEIDTAPSVLDGQNILIVDEVISTGRTLDIAIKLFQEAFPSSNFQGTHWMGGIVQKNGATGNADIPVWYNDKVEAGRGVGDRNDVVSRKSKSLTQRLGSVFLSTAQNYKDTSAQQLREEFRELADDIASHKVLYIPSEKRTIEDYEARAVKMNGLSSLQHYIEKRESLRQQ